MTKTYYHSSTQISAFHATTDAANECEAATSPSGTPTGKFETMAGGASSLAFNFTTPTGEPGVADWPNGLYRCIMAIAANGADITFGLRPASLAFGHFARVDSGLTADLQTATQTEALFSGTGVKIASVTWDPSAGSTTDRFECLIAATRAANHGSQTLELTTNVSSANETNGGISDGPWSIGITQAITVATETDTGQAVSKAKGAGTAAETEAALSVAAVKVRAIGTATETDEAQAVTQPTPPLGRALEIDAAQPITWQLRRLAGTAVEADTAQAVGSVKARVIETVVETEEALAITSPIPALGRALETDTALPIGKARPIGAAIETNSAQAVSVAKTVGTASETATAQPVTRSKTAAISTAIETDEARIITPTGPKFIPITAATETDAAGIIGKVVSVGTASDTETALSIGIVRTRQLTAAAETQAALTLSRALRINPAEEDDLALPVRTPIKVTIGTAAEIDTALVLVIPPPIPPIITRPFTGTTSRPSTGTTPRPNTGVTVRPTL